MLGLGYQELLVILVIVLVLFGANRLPELARSLGSSMREFKKGIDEGKRDNGTNGHAPSSEDPKPLPAALPPCRVCLTPLAADWSHCPRCGTAVEKSSTRPPTTT